MTKKEKEVRHLLLLRKTRRCRRKTDLRAQAYICDKCVTPLHGHRRKKAGPSRAQASQTQRDQRSASTNMSSARKKQKRPSLSPSTTIINGSARSHKENEVEYSKSNVLLLGPTGSGKTLIARTLASHPRCSLCHRRCDDPDRSRLCRRRCRKHHPPPCPSCRLRRRQSRNGHHLCR